ncbi:2-octaprenyl-6-methoxyphenol hydroxylase [Thalassococcus halodurans]|uniref:2-octaprenyl-6-methoxyphenol hydroxylase n=1 Tax=Thalassococcus halodurans TaxID=373675 RepID=A0A1H5X5G1_9RHOB|nr:UbiH/UbiF family hydroxylase [Thalassococcus halodurans]SEG06813.1 2-octaprenyl-6-methoxyphenol hydroxylase [Thalassococcus halodurans]
MTQNALSFDIVISGGGIAGLTAAAAFGKAGFSVLCVDPAPPITTRDADGADLRSTAFLQPARDFLNDIGLWQVLAPFATPLQTMRIVDAGGEVAEPRVTKDFDAADISEEPFGWNLPNWLLRREISAILNDLPNVEFRPGVKAETLFTRTAQARVGLSDGTKVFAKLVIAADGRNSPMRDAAGIGVQTTRFGQKALAFAVTHSLPHRFVSTEIHRTGGPFTLVPLPDFDGKPSSAIVWMEESAKADALMALDETDFEAAMNERSCELYGPLKLASKRTIWPIIAQKADSLIAERLAVVAEAAHVVPPIGAQGLNMSLKDIATLLDLATKHPEQLGDQLMLDAYERARYGDVKLRVAGITALNRTSMASDQTLRDLRAKGIDLLHGVGPVRHGLMKLGLGAK